MTQIEKIKAEIKREINLCNKYSTLNLTESTRIGNNAQLTVLKELLSFIDSLEEPIRNDLEEAARRIATRHSHITGDTYYANDAWFFKKGAQWQKDKMMEDAVDGEIYFNMDYLQYHINTEPLTHFHHGDKVKLIIIKEE